MQPIDTGHADPPRPKTSRPSQSRKGDRPPSSRNIEQQGGSSSHGERKPPGSSHGKRRPSTSGPSSRKDVRSGSSSSRQRPSSSKEHASHRQSDSQRRARIDTIPENRPVQWTEDQTIISRVTELHTLIDQHAENFYLRNEIVGSDPELDDPKTRHAIIRRRIAQTIIDRIIRAETERYGVDLHSISWLNLTDPKLRHRYPESGD
jgi:hypothetical protein